MRSDSVIERSDRLAGVRYNVIRRPKQYQGKKETPSEFYARLAKIVAEEHGVQAGMVPGDHGFFCRFKAEIDEGDRAIFEEQCLIPCLENICDDYEWWADCYRRGDDNPYDWETRAGKFERHTRRHFRMPYGIYNPLLEGRSSEVDEFLHTGNRVGLERHEDLFKELPNG
jgi:hypothetical protein